MRLQRYNRGEISLGYLLKFGLAAFLALTINTVFDYVKGRVFTYKVQIMTTSTKVTHVKQCVYKAVMDGRISQLPDCSHSGIFQLSESPVSVSYDGEITLEDVIEDNPVKVVLTPVFNGSTVTWKCSGSPSLYMPSTCEVKQ